MSWIMARWERFFAPALGPDDVSATLEGAEAHHLRTVLRAKAGTEIQLFNGAGLEAIAVVESVGRTETFARVLRVERLPDDRLAIAIASALPKGDRASWMVEKLAELGVRELIPLRTERSVAEPGEGKLEKLRRTAIEACKQSGRGWIPSIADPVDWRAWAPTAVGSRALLDPTGEETLASLSLPPSVFAIGPEGGWTSEELAIARLAGWRIARLPGAVLRVETAAIAVASWARLREFGGP